MHGYTYRTIAYQEELQNWPKNVLGFFNRKTLRVF